MGRTRRWMFDVWQLVCRLPPAPHYAVRQYALHDAEGGSLCSSLSTNAGILLSYFVPFGFRNPTRHRDLAALFRKQSAIQFLGKVIVGAQNDGVP